MSAGRLTRAVFSPQSCAFLVFFGLLGSLCLNFPELMSMVVFVAIKNGEIFLFLTDEGDQMGDMLGTFGSDRM